MRHRSFRQSSYDIQTNNIFKFNRSDWKLIISVRCITVYRQKFKKNIFLSNIIKSPAVISKSLSKYGPQYICFIVVVFFFRWASHWYCRYSKLDIPSSFLNNIGKNCRETGIFSCFGSGGSNTILLPCNYNLKTISAPFIASNVVVVFKVFDRNSPPTVL